MPEKEVETTRRQGFNVSLRPKSIDDLKDLASQDMRSASSELEWLIAQEVERRRSS